MNELRLFRVLIEGWAAPLLIRAYDSEDAEGLTQILFKVPSNVGVKVLEEVKSCDS